MAKQIKIKINKTKQSLGQFYTTNYKYILQDLYIPDDVANIIEPFAGNGNLLDFIEHQEKYNVLCYDIAPKRDFIVARDTLVNPPSYTNKFIITNPPYLARNKSAEKTLYDKYDVNDLYKCFIKELITNIAQGGIIIIPLNFWSSIRKADIELRRLFLSKYDVIHINVFEEKVFVDTTYTICSFQFQLRANSDADSNSKSAIKIKIYPSGKNIETMLNAKNNYIIGGKIYHLASQTTNNKRKIIRLTKGMKNEGITNILVKCIDDNAQNRIALSYVDDGDRYIDNTPNLSARTYATLVIEPPLDITKQKDLIERFNNYLNILRKKYHSLFLTNYRESKDIARKRISFNLIYEIVGYLLSDEIEKTYKK